MFNAGRNKMARLTDVDCTMYFQKQFGASAVVHMKEYQQFVAHACKVAGVMQISFQQIVLAGRTVLYAQCPCCKKLWYFVPQVL